MRNGLIASDALHEGIHGLDFTHGKLYKMSIFQAEYRAYKAEFYFQRVKRLPYEFSTTDDIIWHILNNY